MDMRRDCQSCRGVYCGLIMLNRTRKRILRSPLLAVLLVALVFRAAVPAGYMPITASDGSVRMGLCQGHLPSAPDTTGSRDDSHSGASQCPFALSDSPPLSSNQMIIAVELPPLAEVMALDLDSNILFSPVRGLQARAPPVSTLIDS
jgi:hypothetical protein